MLNVCPGLRTGDWTRKATYMLFRFSSTATIEQLAGMIISVVALNLTTRKFQYKINPTCHDRSGITVVLLPSGIICPLRPCTTWKLFESATAFLSKLGTWLSSVMGHIGASSNIAAVDPSEPVAPGGNGMLNDQRNVRLSLDNMVQESCGLIGRPYLKYVCSMGNISTIWEPWPRNMVWLTVILTACRTGRLNCTMKETRAAFKGDAR